MGFRWETGIAGRLISTHVLYKRGKYSMLWGKSGKREGERERSAHTVARHTSLQKAHAQETDTLQLYTCITILVYDNPREGIYLMISAYTAQIESLINRDTLFFLGRHMYFVSPFLPVSTNACMHPPPCALK